MSRTEIRRFQENKQLYYESMYRAQSYSYPCEKVSKERETIKRSSLDDILFTIIKGLLVCLVLVFLLAIICSAEPAVEEMSCVFKMNPDTRETSSVETAGDAIQTVGTFRLNGTCK